MSGPEKYPGASTSYWYQNKYPGDKMNTNVVVLHTTEGTSLPDYSGGSVAPNLTAVPDFKNQKMKWYQHFDIDISSRALVNAAGGVETNTLNVCQIEMVGTCDPSTHKKWGSTQHIYWPEAPEWALKEIAVFLAWMNANHGVPLSGPSTWKAYPASYGTGSSARMSFSAWENFKGICGHSHVPENDHGDPGAIDFKTLISLAKGDPGKPSPDKPDDPGSGGGVSRKKVTINGLQYGYGATGSQVTKVGQALVKKGFGKHYTSGPGPNWTDADTENYSDYQKSLGYTGSDADGVPGETSLKKLLGTLPGKSVSTVVFPGASFFKNGKKSPTIAAMHKRLVAEGCNKYQSTTNTDVWGSGDVASYAAWQRKLGYTGSAADGIPGKTSWDKLKVVA